MLYLLDANILIAANRDYYPIYQIPEYWDWLIHNGKKGNIKIPIEIIDEINVGNKKEDNLLKWIATKAFKDNLILDEEVDLTLFK